MADIGRVTITRGDVGQVEITQPNRTTIVSNNYRPKPNVALIELNDVSTTGMQDRYSLTFVAANSRFEFKSSTELINAVYGGNF
jgi:hypothetical protein